MACDGCWDTVTNQKAVDIVLHELKATNGDCVKAAIKLKEHAFWRGSNDNISVIIVLLDKYLPEEDGDRASSNHVSDQRTKSREPIASMVGGNKKGGNNSSSKKDKGSKDKKACGDSPLAGHRSYPLTAKDNGGSRCGSIPRRSMSEALRPAHMEYTADDEVGGESDHASQSGGSGSHHHHHHHHPAVAVSSDVSEHGKGKEKDGDEYVNNTLDKRDKKKKKKEEKERMKKEKEESKKQKRKDKEDKKRGNGGGGKSAKESGGGGKRKKEKKDAKKKKSGGLMTKGAELYVLFVFVCLLFAVANITFHLLFAKVLLFLHINKIFARKIIFFSLCVFVFVFFFFLV